MADDGGLSSFQARMRAIPKAAQKAVRRAMERSAEEISAAARELSPVDTGALRDSIDWKWGQAPSGSMTLSEVSDGKGLSITIYAGSDEAYYARYVEFGTQAGVKGQRVVGKGAGNRQSKKGRFSYRTHPGTPARPFFFPAYRLHKKRASNRIKRAISKAVKEAGK